MVVAIHRGPGIDPFCKKGPLIFGDPSRMTVLCGARSDLGCGLHDDYWAGSFSVKVRFDLQVFEGLGFRGFGGFVLAVGFVQGISDYGGCSVLDFSMSKNSVCPSREPVPSPKPSGLP